MDSLINKSKLHADVDKLREMGKFYPEIEEMINETYEKIEVMEKIVDKMNGTGKEIFKNLIAPILLNDLIKNCSEFQNQVLINNLENRDIIVQNLKNEVETLNKKLEIVKTHALESKQNNKPFSMDEVQKQFSKIHISQNVDIPIWRKHDTANFFIKHQKDLIYDYKKPITLKKKI